MNKAERKAYDALRNVLQREKLAAQSKARRLAHPERSAGYTRKWREKSEENRLTAKKATLKWRLENPEKSKSAKKAWNRAHPYKDRMYKIARESCKSKALVKWRNRFFISEIYSIASLRTKMLGILHHVDHIVPLKSPIVCGLHVENNLRVIDAKTNCSKGNRVWPDMPCG